MLFQLIYLNWFKKLSLSYNVILHYNIRNQRTRISALGNHDEFIFGTTLLLVDPQSSPNQLGEADPNAGRDPDGPDQEERLHVAKGCLADPCSIQAAGRGIARTVPGSPELGEQSLLAKLKNDRN